MSNWHAWLIAWAEIGESVITLLTWGVIKPLWSYSLELHYSIIERAHDLGMSEEEIREWKVNFLKKREAENGNRNDPI